MRAGGNRIYCIGIALLYEGEIDFMGVLHGGYGLGCCGTGKD